MGTITGGCLCGAIKFETAADPMFAGNCHCDDCRQATGAVFATLTFVPGDQLVVTGTPKKFDHKADSGSTLTKHFCGDCGSTLFSTNDAGEGRIGIMAGVIREQDSIQPQFNVYVSSKIPTTPMDPGLAAYEKMPG